MIRSRSILVALTAATFLLSACDFGTGGHPTDEEWLAIGKRDVFCENDEVNVISKVRHDLTGDDHGEWFVTFRCGASPAAQVVVFPGTTDGGGSRIIRRLSDTREDPGKRLNLDAGCIYFAGNRVIIRGERVGRPGVPVLRIATWNGTEFDEPEDITPAKITFPGCA